MVISTPGTCIFIMVCDEDKHVTQKQEKSINDGKNMINPTNVNTVYSSPINSQIFCHFFPHNYRNEKQSHFLKHTLKPLFVI